jgi:hypothetical protein
MNRIVAMKNYGPEWYTTFGLGYREAAAALSSIGVDVVLIQNAIDPLPTTAVEQGIGDEYADRMAAYDDHAFRDALHDAGLRFIEATSVFFDPALWRADPSIRPVGADGTVIEPHDWYVGLCPTHPGHLAERAETAERVVSEFKPDGLFLGWIRFPAFWETWLPGRPRSEFPEGCFCDRCLETFQADTGIELPDGPTSTRASILRNDLRAEWTDWKCRTIGDAVGTIKRAAQRADPDIEITINTLPFRRADHDNAMEEITGQRYEEIAQHADVFEMMFYHQILKRDPVEMIRANIAEAEQRTTRTLLACLQTKADYVRPPFDHDGRTPIIPMDEHRAALRAVADSAADGVMIYHWRDYLEAEANGDHGLSNALRAFKDGTL